MFVCRAIDSKSSTTNTHGFLGGVLLELALVVHGTRVAPRDLFVCGERNNMHTRQRRYVQVGRLGFVQIGENVVQLRKRTRTRSELGT